MFFFVWTFELTIPRDDPGQNRRMTRMPTTTSRTDSSTDLDGATADSSTTADDRSADSSPPWTRQHWGSRSTRWDDLWLEAKRQQNGNDGITKEAGTD